MKRKKYSSPVAKAFLRVLLTVGIVFVGINVWQFFEKKQQKPRVLAACAGLVAEMADEKYSLDELWKLLDGGKTECSGNVSFSSIEEKLFPEKYQAVVSWLEHSDIAFVLKKDDIARKAEYLFEVSPYFLTFTLDGYLDDTEWILHLPALHESYISFSPDNLRAQYEDSFLHTIFGEQLMLPQDNLTDKIFDHAGTYISSEKEAVSAGFFDMVKAIRELYDEITVEKTDDSKAAGNDKNGNSYRVLIPSDVFRQFFGEVLWQNTGHTLVPEEESLPFLVYLDRKNQISMLELAETELLADEKSILCKFSLQLKGTENPWDKLQLDAVFQLDGTPYGLTVIVSNEFADTMRTVHIRASLTEPYVMKLLDIVMDYTGETGETVFDITCKIPALSFDGEFGLKPLSTVIEKPKEDAVRIFELNLLDALKLTNTIKWGFFKNME